ncbi:MAG: superoxide dismutase [Clostridium sp.]|nr:superoxide dismutase [Clostridium sp.]
MTGLFSMPNLPYATDALAPVISRETVELHYGKHLQTYVTQLNALIQGTEYEGKPLVELVKTVPEGPIFNNAGQVLNHTLYFHQFRPSGLSAAQEPEGRLAAAIDESFGSFGEFKQQMNAAATTLFGAGWAWLAQQKDGTLVILKCTNGDNPVRHGQTPLLGFDVWEHAYYVDYQNRRADHVNALWNIIDWSVVASRLEK